MSVLLLVLACAVFAQSVSEFMLSGLLDALAAEFDVTLAVAGWATSAFAVGMVIGAPVMALWARRFPPRSALTAFLAVFLLAHVVGALTTEFSFLLASRLIAALANAGFLAVALGVAVRSVPAERTARATGTLLWGTTLALIVGVPAGALVAQLLGWRATFWAVAALAAASLAAVLIVRMPPVPAGDRTSVAGELAVLRRGPVLFTLAAAVLVNAGTFSVYTYLAQLVTTTSGGGPGLVAPALALFGVGSFLGVSLSARVADRHPRGLLLTGGVLLAGGWAVLALLGRTDAAVALVVITATGLGAFAVGSGLIARSLLLASGAESLGGGVTTAAFNVGATLGPLVGGATLAGGPTGPVWTAALLAALAIVPTALGFGVSATRVPSRSV